MAKRKANSAMHAMHDNTAADTTLAVRFVRHFTQQFAPALPQHKPVFAIAVSGGADSFALLHLMQQWTQQNAADLVAVTVDHNLRPESRAEALHVAAWCAQHDIPHHILTWQHEMKPETAIQSSARKARRALLCDFCVQQKIDTLILGHQADDQAETFWMRLQRGSGLTGLRAIQPVTRDAVTRITLWRPLLPFQRAELRAYCVANTLPFLDDPSNENIAFERVRVRRFLADHGDLMRGIAKATTRLRRADNALAAITRDWCDTYLHHDAAAQTWHIPLDLFAAQHAEIRLRILETIVSRITGERRPSLSSLEAWDTHITAADFSGTNALGCMARPKMHDGTRFILFCAEPPRRTHA